MKGIEKTIKIEKEVKTAFRKFVHELNEWWPGDYTWSQNSLKEIRIDGKEGGLCSEVGPHGFRCDWGRVTSIQENEQIGLKWQISAKREPVPDPSQASDLKVEFKGNVSAGTIVILTHTNFENHENGEEYREMMDSEFGWDYILKCYKEYCEHSHK